MEDVFRRSGHRVAIDNGEEKRVDSAGDPEEIAVKIGNRRPHNKNNVTSPSPPEQIHFGPGKQERVVSNPEGSSLGPDSRPSSSSQKDQDEQLESARAEMGEVRQENQRLKMYLDRIMKDYRTLQMQFINIVQQESKKSTDTSNDRDQDIEEPELVSLSLGRFSSDSKKNDNKNKTYIQGKDEHDMEGGLSLALDSKFEASKSDANESLPNPSPAHTSEVPKEEAGETWPPSKVSKAMRSGDDEILRQSQVKRARVSVRARCDTPTLNDGCQWRKYGQKIAKGNPCPRAYYRCTVAPSCPVRKQVQRCADDMSILITTYEGTHNHPLPVSATAMASTTSAAASMLLCGSSSSSGSGSRSVPSTTIAGANNLRGLNFFVSDNSKHYYLPNSSLSTSPSHPTITLDLTTNAPSSSSSHFSRFTSNYPPVPRYSSANLNFSSSEASSSMSWGNGLISYGSSIQPSIKNQIGTLNLGRQPLENVYQSYMQKNNLSPSQQSLPPDTIAAATKAITTEPSFQSALAAALKSIIATGNSGTSGANQASRDSFGQKLKWDEQFPVSSSHSETVKVSGCASSYLNISTTDSQPGSLIFLPPSLPFSTPKSTPASLSDNREHTN